MHTQASLPSPILMTRSHREGRFNLMISQHGSNVCVSYLNLRGYDISQLVSMEISLKDHTTMQPYSDILRALEQLISLVEEQMEVANAPRV